MTEQKNILILFVKNPEPGKVKTRLGEKIGYEHAAEIYRRLLLHLKEITIPLPVEKKIYSHQGGDKFGFWKDCGYPVHIQCSGDIGRKMEDAFDRELTKGEKVVIVGSDSPELTGDIILRAFDMLDDRDVVLGPAYDGGYYLIGMKKKNPSLFRNIEWSTGSVLSRTGKILKEKGLSSGYLPTLTDIDTFEDLMNTPYGNLYDEWNSTG